MNEIFCSDSAIGIPVWHWLLIMVSLSRHLRLHPRSTWQLKGYTKSNLTTIFVNTSELTDNRLIQKTKLFWPKPHSGSSSKYQAKKWCRIDQPLISNKMFWIVSAFDRNCLSCSPDMFDHFSAKVIIFMKYS